MKEKDSSDEHAFDKLYLCIALLLILMILYKHNALDIAYLAIFTIYYFRIKIHRKNKH